MAPKREKSMQHAGRWAHRPRQNNYSHISIQAAEPASTEPNAAGTVSRPSVQETIEDDLVYAKKLASTASCDKSPPGKRPKTFAEATMSSRIRGTLGGNSSKKESEKRDCLQGLRSYGALSLLSSVKKRKKAPRWATLDLSAIPDDASDASNGNASAPMSPALSPPLYPTYFPSFRAADTPPLPFPNYDSEMTGEQSHVETGIEDQVEFEGSYLQQADGAQALPAYNSIKEFSAESQNTASSSSKLVQTTIEVPAIHLDSNGDFTYSSTPRDTSLTDFKDSPQTKKNFENVMAQIHQYTSAPASGQQGHLGQDSFDSITWDPDLPPGTLSADKSPEKITLKPKPVVAYTTVGSVVNPNNVPQFSAPNRIQREGAGRRPLMTMTNRQYDSLFQTHSISPSPLGMQSPMPYAQLLQSIPPTYDELRPRSSAPPSQPSSTYEELRPKPNAQVQLPSSHGELRPQSAASLHQLPSSSNLLTDQEKQVLAKLDEAILKIPLNTRKTDSATSSVSSSAPAFRPRILLSEDDAKRAYGAQGRQGLEKMQTLQRLARFENPMREHALSRLSEFSVNAQASIKATAVPGPLETIFRSAQSSSRDEVNTGFTFPPPGLPSTTNPLYGAYSSSTYNSAPPSRPPGYPQPLTAGPPGQRLANQAYLNLRNATMNAAESSNSSRQPSGFTSYGTPDFQQTAGSSTVNSDTNMNQPEPVHQPSRFAREDNTRFASRNIFRQNPWPYTTQQQQLVETGSIYVNSVAPVSLGPHTVLIDTIPNDMMAKYYPNGPPQGLGYYRPPGPKTEMSHRVIERELLPDHGGDSYAEERRKIELDNFFYHGQRRYFMTAEDHIVELESRASNPGAVPLPQPRVPTALSPEDVDKMEVSEAVKPAIDGLFGTILAYAETSARSRTKMSGWTPAKPELIDDSVEGNSSLFGEDWGNTKSI